MSTEQSPEKPSVVEYPERPRGFRDYFTPSFWKFRRVVRHEQKRRKVHALAIETSIAEPITASNHGTAMPIPGGHAPELVTRKNNKRRTAAKIAGIFALSVASGLTASVLGQQSDSRSAAQTLEFSKLDPITQGHVRSIMFSNTPLLVKTMREFAICSAEMQAQSGYDMLQAESVTDLPSVLKFSDYAQQEKAAAQIADDADLSCVSANQVGVEADIPITFGPAETWTLRMARSDLTSYIVNDWCEYRAWDEQALSETRDAAERRDINNLIQAGDTTFHNNCQ